VKQAMVKMLTFRSRAEKPEICWRRPFFNY
jgi:hypothetical protein